MSNRNDRLVHTHGVDGVHCVPARVCRVAFPRADTEDREGKVDDIDVGFTCEEHRSSVFDGRIREVTSSSDGRRGSVCPVGVLLATVWLC